MVGKDSIDLISASLKEVVAMELSTGERCGACGEARMVMDALHGIYACESCGFMGDQAEAQLGSEFQLGHVIERRGTNIAERDTGVGAAKGLMRGQISHNFYTGFTSWSERHKVETMKKVQRITALLRVPGDKVEQVKHLLECTVDGDWGSGRWVDVVVAACVYIVIRQSQLPLTIPEVADCVNCDVVELGRMYNRVLQKLNITVPHVDLLIFLERALSTLPAISKQSKDIIRKITRQGNILLSNATKWFITTGRRPLPVVAAVLQLVLESNNISAHITDVARELHAGIWATRLRYRECKDSLVGVAQKLPWGADVTPKSVLRHLPFILQFLELKMKLGRSDATQGPTCNNLSFCRKRALSVGSRQPDSYLLNTKVGFASDAREGNIYQKINDLPGDETNEGRPEKYLRVSGRHGPPMEKGLLEVNMHNEEESSPGHDCPGGLRPSPKRAEKILEDSFHNEVSPSTTKHPVSGSCPWNVLPVAFVASQEARKRRIHKIHLAKIRINQHRSSLAKKYGIPHTLAAPASPSHIAEIDVKVVDDVQSAPDCEDLRIEKLLLKGASGAELETGYYKTLEAQFCSEKENAESTENDQDNDLIEYLHTRSEVEFLTELNKQKLGDGVEVPDDSSGKVAEIDRSLTLSTEGTTPSANDPFKLLRSSVESVVQLPQYSS